LVVPVVARHSIFTAVYEPSTRPLIVSGPANRVPFVAFLVAMALGFGLVAGCGNAQKQSVSGGQGGLRFDLGDAEVMNCSASNAGAAGVIDACSGSALVDYAHDVAPVLSRCSGEICHNIVQPSDARWFVGRPADECCGARVLVDPGHPELSYLVDKLRGTNLCQGTRMPLDAPALSAPDIATIEAWICQGAQTPP